MDNNSIIPMATAEIVEAIPVNEKQKTRVLSSDIPEKASELHSLAKRVSEKWNTVPADYPLNWMSPEKFAELTQKYGEAINSGGSAGSSRKIIKNELDTLNREIRETVKNIKYYLYETYGSKSAPAYYAEFGFVHRGNTYIFPTNREARKNALIKVCDGIQKHGFENHKYGLEYWQNIEQKYSELYLQTYEKSSIVSSSSGDKAEMKKLIRKVLSSIKMLVKANYPDTWKKQLRVWGFQREKI